MIKNNFLNRNFGIWSKNNGIEWARELNWKNSKVNKYQDPIYTYATSKKHSLQLEIEDFINTSNSLLLKKITIHNESKERQDLTLFFQQDFDDRDGTAFFSMSNRTLYHEYEGSYLLFNGILDEKGISQYTTWQKNDLHKTNIVNVESGSLAFNPISAGRVKSAFSLETTVLPYEIKHGYYWCVLGENLMEIDGLNQLVKSSPERFVREFIESDIHKDKFIPLSN